MVLFTRASPERVMDQTVSCRLLTAEASVQSWVNSLRFVVKKLAPEQGFPRAQTRRPILHTLINLLCTLTRRKKGRSLFGNQTALYRSFFSNFFEVFRSQRN
jgi:hypothetical protein